mgnify:CR=1 FL=1
MPGPNAVISNRSGVKIVSASAGMAPGWQRVAGASSLSSSEGSLAARAAFAALVLLVLPNACLRYRGEAAPGLAPLPGVEQVFGVPNQASVGRQVRLIWDMVEDGSSTRELAFRRFFVDEIVEMRTGVQAQKGLPRSDLVHGRSVSCRSGGSAHPSPP